MDPAGTHVFSKETLPCGHGCNGSGGKGAQDALAPAFLQLGLPLSGESFGRERLKERLRGRQKSEGYPDTPVLARSR